MLPSTKAPCNPDHASCWSQKRILDLAMESMQAAGEDTSIKREITQGVHKVRCEGMQIGCILDDSDEIDGAFYLAMTIVFLTTTANNCIGMVELSGFIQCQEKDFQCHRPAVCCGPY
jgi:hypothetical protein